MSTIVKLDGWNVHIERKTFKGKDDNGHDIEVDGSAMYFTEVEPDTGNVIVFEFVDRVRDYIHTETSPIVVPDFVPPEL